MKYHEFIAGKDFKNTASGFKPVWIPDFLFDFQRDVVLTPFMGVGSEVYVAVRNGRKGVGVELKRSYYKQAVLNVKSAMRKREAKKLV